MKAKAKKILALIMAMVMCLSLAAPAFAVKAGAPSTNSSTNVTSAVVTVEANASTPEWTTTGVVTPGNFIYDGDTVVVLVKSGVAYGLIKGEEYTPKGDITGKDNTADNIEITVDDSDPAFKMTSVTTDSYEYIGENMILAVDDSGVDKDGTGVKAKKVLVKGDKYTVTTTTAAITGGDPATAGKYKVDTGVGPFYSIAGSTDKSGNYTVKKIEAGGTYAVDDKGVITPNADFAGKVTNATQRDTIKVTKTVGQNVIGKQMTEDSYTVKYSAVKDFDNSSNYVEATVTMGDNSGKKKSFSDLDASVWTALPEGQTFKGADGKTYQVKGSVYQEPQGDTGLVVAYFKLNLADERDNWTSDTVYYKNITPQATISAAGMGAVLAEAVYCSDDYGTASTVAITNTDATNKTKVAIKGTTLPDDDVVVYSFTAVNPSEDVTVDNTNGAGDVTAKTSGKVTVDFGTKKEITTGSFQVSIKSTTKKTGVTDPIDAYVTDPAQAETILKKNWNSTSAKLESVTAGTGNFLTVNVSKVVTADAYKVDMSPAVYSKNVWYFTLAGKKTPVLVDQTAAGWYNATTEQGADANQIAANTEALGQVIVRKSDVPLNVTIKDNDSDPATLGGGDYYVFDKVEDIKLSTDDCKSAKKVPYRVAVVNPWKGDKQNKLVNEVKKVNSNKDNIVTDALAQVSTTNEVSVAPYWYSELYNTPNAEFVKTGELELDADSHKNKVEIVEKTDATCEKPGTKTVKVKCTDCNQIISETTTEIPVVTDPVEVNTKDTTNDAAGETVPLMVFDDTRSVGNDPATTHYLKKAVTTTTVSEDKTSTVVTTEFYCNFGVKHPDKTRVVTLKTTSLKNGGRWNFITWDGRNEEKVITGDSSTGTPDTEKNLWGFEDGITIADSDVELEGLALNRKSDSIIAGKNNTTVFDTNSLQKANAWGTVNTGDDLVIHFAKGALVSANATKNPDGSLYTTQTARLDNVYATAASTPETKYYVAKLTGKVTKDPVYTCHTGAATLTVDVYEVAKDAAGWNGTLTDAKDTIGEANLEKNLSKGKVKLLQTFTKDVVIRAQEYHNYDDKTGICKICLQGVQAVEDVKFDATTITVESINWTGKVAQPKVTVYDTKGNKLLKGIDYVVEQVEETDAGEHDITVVGQDTYKASRATVKYTINKVAATLKKKSAPSKLTASATKKVTGQIKMTVKGGKVAKYKVTKKVSGVSVNKSGKITVKKGNKKAGTLKVKVTMTPDANHTAAKAVTVKVAIKAAPAAKKTTKK